MDDAAPAADQPCPGTRLKQLTLDPDHTLIIELAGPLGCLACGRPSHRWVIPVHQDRILHPDADVRRRAGQR